MNPLFPPVIPGLTESAEGQPNEKTLYSIAMMWRASKKKTAQFLDSAVKMFSPKEPPPEPLESGVQPPVGQAAPPFLGSQPPGGPMGF